MAKLSGRVVLCSADATMELKVKTVKYFKSLASVHHKLIAEPEEPTGDAAKPDTPKECGPNASRPPFTADRCVWWSFRLAVSVV